MIEEIVLHSRCLEVFQRNQRTICVRVCECNYFDIRANHRMADGALDPICADDYIGFIRRAICEVNDRALGAVDSGSDRSATLIELDGTRIGEWQQSLKDDRPVLCIVVSCIDSRARTIYTPMDTNPTGSASLCILQ